MTDMTENTGQRAPRKSALKEHPMVEFLRDYAKRPLAATGAILFLAIALLALFAPLIAPQNPYDLASLSILDSKLEPGESSFGGMTHWLGTDGLGRDVFSAIAYGLRISLTVGATSSLIALVIGTLVGLIAAYAGGRTDTALMRLVDLQMSFPAILIALILLAMLGRGVDKTMIALVAVQWAYYARTVRASALVEREREYIEAAQSLRLSHWRILTRHLLPNCAAPLIVVVTVQIAHAITLEATLSFLGVGLPETEPSLGLLIANGYQYLLSGAYWISIFPGIALLIVIVSINLVGDRLREMLNPEEKR